MEGRLNYQLALMVSLDILLHGGNRYTVWHVFLIAVLVKCLCGV